MEYDGSLYVNKQKKSCGYGASQVHCRGIGSYCVELVYESAVESWCYCGSKNYGRTCNKRFKSYNGSSQRTNNRENLRNISRDARNAFKKLKNYYLILKRRKTKGGDESRK